MKKLFTILIAGVISLTLVSCIGGGTVGSVTLDTNSLTFAASGDAPRVVNVTADNATWTANVRPADASWLSIATDAATITVSVGDYTNLASRSGIITVTPSSGPVLTLDVTQEGIDSIVFAYAETEYYGDYYDNDCGNFDLIFENMDPTGTGYVLFTESFSDLNDLDPVFTPHLYTIDDSYLIYTILPGFLSGGTYYSATLSNYVNGTAIERHSVLAGTVDASFDGTDYSFDITLTLDNGKTVTATYGGALILLSPSPAMEVPGSRDFRNDAVKSK